MFDWFILLTPLLLIPIILLLAFVGCQFKVGPFALPFGGPGDEPVPGDYYVSGLFSPNPAPLGSFNIQIVTRAAYYRRSDQTWNIFRDNIFTYEDNPSDPGTIQTFQFNNTTAGDIPVPGNYQDPTSTDVGSAGTTQPAVFRPNDGTWHVGDLIGNAETSFQFPEPFQLSDKPLPPGNYLADGSKIVALFRPSTGTWFLSDQMGNLQGQPFSFPPAPGAEPDIPVPGDYDGTGKTQPAIFRPSTRQWFVLDRQTGQPVRSFSIDPLVLFDSTIGDTPLPPAVYLKPGPHPFATVLAIYKPLDAKYFLMDLNGKLIRRVTVIPVDENGEGGQTGDRAAPGEYDGYGNVEEVIFRPSRGRWFRADFTVVGGL